MTLCGEMLVSSLICITEIFYGLKLFSDISRKDSRITINNVVQVKHVCVATVHSL